MKTYIITNVEYDTDNQDVNLPKKLEIEVHDYLKDDQEIDDFISDKISNIFCLMFYKTIITFYGITIIILAGIILYNVFNSQNWIEMR